MKQPERRQRGGQSGPKHITTLTLNALERLSLSEDFNRFTEALTTQTKHPSHLTAAVINPKYSLGQEDDFPTQRRPVKRKLSSEREEIVEAWFATSEITIDTMADTPERMLRAKRLAYT